MNPDISIVIPVYNAEKYLSRCIDSILAQSFENFEILLIDDGSKDSSPIICDKYTKIDARVHAFHRSNGGAAAARNFGIKNSTGEYLMFVDADDYVYKDFLKIMYTWAVTKKCDIVQCSYTITYDSYAEFMCTNTSLIIESGRESLARFFDSRISDIYVFWNKIYRKKVWNNIFIPEGMICEDQAVLHELYYAADKVGIISDKLYAYYMTDESVMRGKYNKKQLDIINALERRLSFLEQNHLDEYIDLCKQNICSVILSQYYYCYQYLPDETDIRKKLKLKFNHYALQLLAKKNIRKGIKFTFGLGLISPLLAEKYNYYRRNKGR